MTQKVITQSELEEFCEERDTWSEDRLARRPTAWPAPFCDAADRLRERFEAGAKVESGKFRMRRDRTGMVVVYERAKMPACAPRAARVDTPSAAQLQAWFDLPS